MTPELRDLAEDLKEYMDLKVDPLDARAVRIEAHLEKLNGSKVEHAQRIAALEAKQGRVSIATVIAALSLLSSCILGALQLFG